MPPRRIQSDVTQSELSNAMGYALDQKGDWCLVVGQLASRPRGQPGCGARLGHVLRRAVLPDQSLQLCVLRLGLLEDGDVGVRVFPQRKKILISVAGLGCIALEHIGAGETKLRKRMN